jgi:hypothetical protein
MSLGRGRPWKRGRRAIASFLEAVACAASSSPPALLLLLLLLLR